MGKIGSVIYHIISNNMGKTMFATFCVVFFAGLGFVWLLQNTNFLHVGKLGIGG